MVSIANIRRKKMKLLQKMIMLLMVLTAIHLEAEEKSIFSFPQTANGRRSAAYFAAFNAAGEDAMEKFLRENLSADALQHDLLAQRLARFYGFKKQSQSLAPEKLLHEGNQKTSFLVRDGQGQWLEFTFAFEKGKNGKITAILAAPVAAEDAADLSGPPLSRNEAMSRIRALLDEQARADFFSGAVLLAYEGQVLLHEARGLASIEYGVANRPDTRFNLGSLNKLFTRIAIGQLAEQGKLSLDDKIEKFLPDFPNPEAATKVTLRQMLDMTSGIGDFFGKKYTDTPKDRIRSLNDYLQLFAGEPLLFQPGTDRRYSNGGYIVLGLIIEKASGENYYDYMRENIYWPAGMESTDHIDADMPAVNVASGYTRNWDEIEHDAEPRRNNLYTRPARGSSAGGGYSTAMDLFKFAMALKGGKLLGPLGKEWFNGPQAFAGGAPGINSELDMETVPGWTIVVMANFDPPAAGKLAQKINILLKRLQ
jgi:CubicO group peptidase (beta-lactamase class C family)